MEDEIRQYQEHRARLLSRLKSQLEAEMKRLSAVMFTNRVRYEIAQRDALHPDELSEAELVGILVRNVREVRGLSENRLADASGVAYETISRVENGHHRAHRRTVEKLARALDVRPRALEPDFVFAHWPAVYQSFVSDRELLEEQKEQEQKEQEKAKA